MNSRTPAASRRAISRKQSHLISCHQPGLLGGLGAGLGRQGSIKPFGRTLKRNNIGPLNKRASVIWEVNGAGKQKKPRTNAGASRFNWDTSLEGHL